MGLVNNMGPVHGHFLSRCTKIITIIGHGHRNGHFNCKIALIAHNGINFPATRNFDWQRASSKSPKQTQNQKFELLFRIDYAALSHIRSETKLTCALYKLLSREKVN